MKKFIATILSVAAVSAVYGQGTIATLSNNLGATIYPIFNVDGTTKLTGADSRRRPTHNSIELFLSGP